MSQKQDKKLRKLFRKDYQAEAKRMAAELIPQLRKTVKPAPKYFPKSLWYKLAGTFLNLN